jgi:hypothetical protein
VPYVSPNEAVEKPLEGPDFHVFGGPLTPPTIQIVDCGSFWAVVFCSLAYRFLKEGFSTASTLAISRAATEA